MFTTFKTKPPIIALFVCLLLTVGCGENDDSIGSIGFKVNPADGSRITGDTLITITFDKEPLDVISLPPILSVDFGKIAGTISVTFVSVQGHNYHWELEGKMLKLQLTAVKLPLGETLDIPKGELIMHISGYDGKSSESYTYTVVRK